MHSPTGGQGNSSEQTDPAAAKPNGSQEGGSGNVDSPDSTFVPIVQFNSFVSSQFKEAVGKTDEFKILKLKSVSSAFFRMLEGQLNGVMMDIYQALAGHESAVCVNLKALNSSKSKQDGLQVSLPIPEGFLLPLINRVQPTTSKGSIWCVKLFGVSWLFTNKLFGSPVHKLPFEFPSGAINGGEDGISNIAINCVLSLSLSHSL